MSETGSIPKSEASNHWRSAINPHALHQTLMKLAPHLFEDYQQQDVQELRSCAEVVFSVPQDCQAFDVKQAACLKAAQS